MGKVKKNSFWKGVSIRTVMFDLLQKLFRAYPFLWNMISSIHLFLFKGDVRYSKRSKNRSKAPAADERGLPVIQYVLVAHLLQNYHTELQS